MSAEFPTESDFVVYGDLDERSACSHMLGKSRDEVRALLDDNFLYYQEDFMFMGPVAFCFYVDAMIGHITRSYDSDNARMYHDLCRYRLSDRMAPHMHACAGRVAASLDWVASRMAECSTPGAEAVERTRDAYRRLAATGAA